MNCKIRTHILAGSARETHTSDHSDRKSVRQAARVGWSFGRYDGKPSSYNRATEGLVFHARAMCTSHWLWIGNIGENWALEFYRRGLIAITTLLPRGSQERFDLEDTMCLGLDITSKESVHTGEEGCKQAG